MVPSASSFVIKRSTTGLPYSISLLLLILLLTVGLTSVSALNIMSSTIAYGYILTTATNVYAVVTMAMVSLLLIRSLIVIATYLSSMTT
jgi:hypothetical protein